MAAPYAAVHASPQGEGDARPTALQIIDDEGLTGKLKNKVFLITGSSSGIGTETARAIAATGATVYCAVRDIEKGKKVLADILEPGRVELLHMDLESLESVRAAAAEFLSRTANVINVLVCNAGVMAIPAPGTRTVDGFETQFATNHLAHFLLFNLLKPGLLAASTPEFNSRVVTVASAAHKMGEVRLDDYNFNKGEYNPWNAYAQSKTANIYMATYIDRHFGPQGLHATSVHPGSIWSPLQKYLTDDAMAFWASQPGFRPTIKSTAQGAATTIWAAVGKEWEGKGGKYLENVQVSPPMKEGGQSHDQGYATWAFDEEKEDRYVVGGLVEDGWFGLRALEQDDASLLSIQMLGGQLGEHFPVNPLQTGSDGNFLSE